MPTVAPGLHMVPLGMVNAYLLETADGLVLVDSGFPGSERKILAALGELGAAPRRLAHIVVTHNHPDHVGSAAAVARATGAQVWMHALDAPLAERGERRPVHPSPGLLPLLMKGLMLILPSQVEPTRVDHRIEGEAMDLPFGGLRAIHAPGHCLGQVVLLWPSRRALIAADTAMNLRGIGPPLANEDAALARATLRRVAALDFDLAVFGHGRPILSGASEKFREAAG